VLGGGAMGVVYEAHDAVIERRVAIKLVRTELLAGDDRDDFVQRFRREAQAAGRCNHPGIVVVFDYALHEGNPFLVMEYVDGTGLDKVLAQGERFAPTAAVHVMAQVLEALGAAHAAGIVHRDIKPANILLTAGAQVKVTDFGVARLASSRLTHHGMAIGTPSYMSPEQCRGDDVDGRSDLFSAAAVLQEMLIGVRPFGGKNVADAAVRLLQDAPEGGDQLEAVGGRPLRVVLLRALAKRPDERFATAGEMAQALRQAVGGAEPDATLTDTIDRTVLAVRERLPASLPAAGGPIDAELLGTVERRLAERVGPIARYLVRSCLRTAHSYEGLCSALAERIDRPEDKARFLDEALKPGRSASVAAAAGPVTSGPAAASAATPGSSLPADEVERIRRALSQVVGPIGKILVQRALAKAPSTDELWELLASDIGSPSDRASFLAARKRD
jgi:serine/threonine-protein kinase